MNESGTTARHAQTRLLCVANARRGIHPGCALRLDQTRLAAPLGRAELIHDFF